MAKPLILPIWQFFDENGDPLAGGQLFTYVAGTSTPAAVYTDSSGSTPHTNPVELDGAGRAEIWLSESTSYKFVLKDADGNLIDDADNVTAPGGTNDEAQSAWTEHEITDGQSATDLTGETIDFTSFSSAVYDAEITRGMTRFANVNLAFQNVNGTPRVRTGMYIGDNPGVTFTLVQVSGQTYKIQAAASSGPGDGTIKLRRYLVPVSS